MAGQLVVAAHSIYQVDLRLLDELMEGVRSVMILSTY